MHIVQIASRISPGTGIAAVAWNLEREFVAQGHTVERFTNREATRGTAQAKTTWGHRWQQGWLRVQLSFGGTRRARRFLADRPGAVTICHNAVMAGDVYVDHRVAVAAVAARGGAVWRLLRNPVLAFDWVWDSIRFRGSLHRLIIAPTTVEADTLRRTYRRIAPEIRVIPHGVDLEFFHPPSAAERTAARSTLGLDEEHRVVLFIGHELRWKGVPLLIDALAEATTVMLLVVGGDARTIPEMLRRADDRGVADRVHFAGMHPDVRPFYAAADMFALPSGYESFALVVVEALATGLPVIATRTGCATDLVVDGETGYLIDPDPHALADRLERIAETDVAQWRSRCRAAVHDLGWPVIAARYADLLAEVQPAGGVGR